MNFGVVDTSSIKVPEPSKTSNLQYSWADQKTTIGVINENKHNIMEIKNKEESLILLE